MLKKQKLLFVTYVVTVTMILRSLRKAGEITEDDLRGYTEDIQKETDKYIAKVDEIAKNKEKKSWKCNSDTFANMTLFLRGLFTLLGIRLLVGGYE